MRSIGKPAASFRGEEPALITGAALYAVLSLLECWTVYLPAFILMNLRLTGVILVVSIRWEIIVIILRSRDLDLLIGT